LSVAQAQLFVLFSFETLPFILARFKRVVWKWSGGLGQFLLYTSLTTLQKELGNSTKVNLQPIPALSGAKPPKSQRYV
jgi:hypothetical protein